MCAETIIKGMGSIPHLQGVAFRVWAPHARRVSVIGSFNDWDGTRHPMRAEENGNWYASVAEAHVGDQYRFLLSTPAGKFTRIDPYAREVTGSVGNAVVHYPVFDWGETTSGSPRGMSSSSTNFTSARSTIRRMSAVRARLPRFRRAWNI